MTSALVDSYQNHAHSHMDHDLHAHDVNIHSAHTRNFPRRPTQSSKFGDPPTLSSNFSDPLTLSESLSNPESLSHKRSIPPVLPDDVSDPSNQPATTNAPLPSVGQHMLDEDMVLPQLPKSTRFDDLDVSCVKLCHYCLFLYFSLPHHNRHGDNSFVVVLISSVIDLPSQLFS